MSTWIEEAPGGHHPEVGTHRKGGLEVGRTGGGARGRSTMSTRREDAPGERHPKVTVVNISTTVGVHLYYSESDVAPNGFVENPMSCLH